MDSLSELYIRTVLFKFYSPSSPMPLSINLYLSLLGNLSYLLLVCASISDIYWEDEERSRSRWGIVDLVSPDNLSGNDIRMREWSASAQSPIWITHRRLNWIYSDFFFSHSLIGWATGKPCSEYFIIIIPRRIFWLVHCALYSSRQSNGDLFNK